jgi:IrrE N-terminal-like domain
MAPTLFDAGHNCRQEASQVSSAFTTEALIAELVRSTGAPDADAAIRAKASEAIDLFRATFGERSMPLDLDALASLLGIARSEDGPAHSKDAELVPVGNGRVVIRVNPDRPETRIRFSVGHEITHTFFPNYQMKTWCRTDARFRCRNNPDDLLEMLCDIGAAELILPAPWFIEDASDVVTCSELAALARKYIASREATLRRFAETHSRSVAAVFFSWKLKPTQQSTIGNMNQSNLFGIDPAESALLAKRLRLDYSIPSPKFLSEGHYLPGDKSIENDGPLYSASTGQLAEGEYWLDLGPSSGQYQVLALPVWTDDGDLGPNWENAVGAIIEPIDVRPSRRNARSFGQGLFN